MLFLVQKEKRVKRKALKIIIIIDIWFIITIIIIVNYIINNDTIIFPDVQVLASP